MDEKLLRTEIQKLIERFERVKVQNKYKSYNEENTKKDFIIPLFRALGWNVEDSEEVKAEEKVSKKRVDYAFRINGVVKFYLEAKSLREFISEPKYAKQAIEYAWNKSIPWAILCNFEGIRVFNADWKWDDKQPMRNQFLDLRYTEYLGSCFKYLTWLSRESFEQGFLDKQATTFSKKVKKLPIDKQLLADFTDYRKLLSKDIFKNNSKMDLSQDNLDEVVQRILDRIIFVRTCEDKEIESEKLESEIRMHGDKEGQLYKELHKKFREYDDGYNSKLFREHLCEKVVISNDVLKEVISGTYRSKHLDIQYDFSAIGADVLGNIYEQYLGHILKKTSQRAKLTNGTVHRKEQGIYYTPTYIVDFIVKNTIGEKLKQHKIKVDELKILDPACGSGSFLLKAFDIICEHEIKKEGKNLQAHFEDVSSGKLLKRKTELLKNCIFGVDLDAQAVEITQLNFLLRLVERRQRLPTLQENIKCGNSLIDDPITAPNKAFKWKEQFEQIMGGGGFDIIIGNPPWVFTRGEHFSDLEKQYFDNYLYKKNIIQSKKGKNIQSGKLNLYSLFVIRSIDLMKNGAIFGFIIPNNILRTTTYDIVRKYILDSCKIISVVDLSTGVFEGVTASSIILIFKKENNKKKRDENEITVISEITNLTNGQFKKHTMKQKYYYDNPSYTFNILSTSGTMKISEKIVKNTDKFGSACKYIIEGIVGSRERDVTDKKFNALYKPFLVGKDIGRYKINYKGKWICYDRDRLHRARPEEVFLSNKIMIQRISGGTTPLVGALDEGVYYTFASINNVVLKDDSKYNIKYILALINSKLLNWYYSTNFSNKSELTVNVSKTFLEQLPIKNIPETQQCSLVKIVDKIISLNKRLIEIGDKQTDERATIVEEIKKIDIQIDELVYKLYGLTKEEIAIVEESLKEK